MELMLGSLHPTSFSTQLCLVILWAGSAAAQQQQQSLVPFVSPGSMLNRSAQTPIDDVAFSADGTRIAIQTSSTVDVFDAMNGSQIATLRCNGCTAMALSSDGNTVATGSDDNNRREPNVWNVPNNSMITTASYAHSRNDQVAGVAFPGNGLKFVTVSGDGAIVRIWSTATGASLYNNFGMGLPRPVRAVAFSSDGTLVATASGDGTATLFACRSNHLTRRVTLTGHSGSVNGVAVSGGNHTRIVTGSSDHTAKIWNVNGAQIVTLAGHSGRVNGVAFSGDGARVATASQDGTAKIWDGVTGALIVTLAGHSGPVNGVAFSGSGTRVATASDDGTARVWCATAPTTDFGACNTLSAAGQELNLNSWPVALGFLARTAQTSATDLQSSAAATQTSVADLTSEVTTLRSEVAALSSEVAALVPLLEACTVARRRRAAASDPGTSSSNTDGGDGVDGGVIAGAVVGILLVLALLGFAAWFVQRQRHANPHGPLMPAQVAAVQNPGYADPDVDPVAANIDPSASTPASDPMGDIEI